MCLKNHIHVDVIEWLSRCISCFTSKFTLSDKERELFERVPPVAYIRYLTTPLSRNSAGNNPSLAELVQRFEEVIIALQISRV